MQTIGILGGMGPYASLDFLKNIIDLNQVEKDWEHPRVILDSNPKIPSRTRAVMLNEKSPVNGMVKSINSIAHAGADFVMVPCNSAHYFYDEVVNDISINWLNLIKICSNVVLKRKLVKPLVLGGPVTIREKMYSKYIPNAQYLNESENSKIYDFIEEIKKSSYLDESSSEVFFNLIDTSISELSIDAVIFACSELPIIFSDQTIAEIPLINSNAIYAQYGLDVAFGDKII